MPITQQIILRHHGEGHLRFQFPKALLKGISEQQLLEALNAHQGIYRVTVFPSQGKLSIRYFEELTDFKTIVRTLYATVLKLEDLAEVTALTPSQPSASRWLSEMSEEVNETFTAAGILARRWFRRTEEISTEPPALMLDFFTDILVLYLVKAHWHLITQHWLKKPWIFRYEWSASIYMIYLLVRSKRSKT